MSARKKPDNSSPDRIALKAARTALNEFASSPKRQEEMRALARESASQAVSYALEKLGIDTEHPEETRKDMVHLRTWRELMEFIRTQGAGATVKWVVTALLAALALGVAAMFTRTAI